MVPLFQLPLNDFIKHPELLLFVAECFLQIDMSKEEEEDFMEGVADDICSSITFLTGQLDALFLALCDLFNMKPYFQNFIRLLRKLLPTRSTQS